MVLSSTSQDSCQEEREPGREGGKEGNRMGRKENCTLSRTIIAYEEQYQR